MSDTTMILTDAQGDYVLALRTCKADGTSQRGFIWPDAGPVEAADWADDGECGRGLHGWLWGEGNGAFADWSGDARWLVVRVPAGGYRDLGGQIKFPRGEVVFCGGRHAATAYLLDHGGRPGAVIGLTVATTGDSIHAATTGLAAQATTTGQSAHASTTGRGALASTSGQAAHALTVGAKAGASTRGHDARASTGGEHAHASTYGHRAHASTVGAYARASTGGEYSHASTAGYGAHASTAGDRAHASAAGTRARASATGRDTASIAIGFESTAKAGPNGVIVLAWHDGSRRRIAVGYVGEDGIEASVLYKVVGGKLTPAE